MCVELNREAKSGMIDTELPRWTIRAQTIRKCPNDLKNNIYKTCLSCITTTPLHSKSGNKYLKWRRVIRTPFNCRDSWICYTSICRIANRNSLKIFRHMTITFISFVIFLSDHTRARFSRLFLKRYRRVTGFSDRVTLSPIRSKHMQGSMKNDLDCTSFASNAQRIRCVTFVIKSFSTDVDLCSQAFNSSCHWKLTMSMLLHTFALSTLTSHKGFHLYRTTSFRILSRLAFMIRIILMRVRRCLSLLSPS